MKTQTISLGHSPDSDDAFMFYGLASGAVNPGNYRFTHILQDIQTLNEWAREGKLEVTAASVHAYAYLQKNYAILSSGASMGATGLAEYVTEDGERIPASRGCTGAQGPLLVAREPYAPENLTCKRIAIPGTLTTAYLTLRLALGDCRTEVMHFDAILPAVCDGKADAGLIIHEGQLTYAAHSLYCLLDLGVWWYEKTGLPLPLGCNLIRRDLGPEAMAEISGILRKSIVYGLEHRREALEYAGQFGRGLDREQADEFVGMYVNQWTVEYGPRGREAVRRLLRCGREKGLIPAIDDPEFV